MAARTGWYLQGAASRQIFAVRCILMRSHNRGFYLAFLSVLGAEERSRWTEYLADLRRRIPDTTVDVLAVGSILFPAMDGFDVVLSE